ncbi:PF13664 domain protein [Bacteriovorax sp. BSW11_IV]|uniref:DUF4149 domain-containing protein n=1 Tax=Bacteriovorax sp. BSW11_IV TaxID=1353529 RepID=UPI00038A2089|nr:DUF4149 domain-containing protein [Bacteriovorax sp. BSW11_IV]EQC44613.1 PF13664 domain protein [Bacteriovorax sp. BSW11_IV]
MLRLVFTLIVAWFSTSCLIDFVAVPTVFRTVSKLNEAGAVGMKIFSTYNVVEVILGLIIFGYALKSVVKKGLGRKIFAFFSLVVFGIALTYNFHVSPRIIEINTERAKYEMESPEYQKISVEHGFYHRLYVNLDKVKVTLLLVMLIMAFQKLPKGENE